MTSKTYLIDNIKQLVDLNEKSVNFEVEFQVQSKNKIPFEFTVSDEEGLLDKNLNYQKSDNGLGYGRFLYDKNKYLSHFLVLKSNNKCECEVKINKTELPIKDEKVVEKEKTPTKETDKKLYILVGGAVLILGIIIFCFFRKSSSALEFSNREFSNTEFQTSKLNFRDNSYIPPIKRIIPVESPKSPENPDISFLQRLKNLKVKS